MSERETSESEIEKHQQEFESHGWLYEFGEDEPNKRYSPHRHGWTRLVTLAGSVMVKKESNDWIKLCKGSICDIQSGQLHEAVVGSDGWYWLAAWKLEEDASFSVHE
jgi:hypothetical protein